MQSATSNNEPTYYHVFILTLEDVEKVAALCQRAIFISVYLVKFYHMWMQLLYHIETDLYTYMRRYQVRGLGTDPCVKNFLAQLQMEQDWESDE
jgi:hypothetical protein